jgi:protein-disulfide isomerase
LRRDTGAPDAIPVGLHGHTQRMARAKPLAELLEECIGPAFAAQGFASTDILGAWPEIVGERLSRYCQPSKLEWPRRRQRDEEGRSEPGTLVVRVEGVFALELQHLAPVVIQRINAHYGWACVGRIVLRSRPPRRSGARGGHDRARRPARRPRSPRHRHRGDHAQALGGWPPVPRERPAAKRRPALSGRLQDSTASLTKTFGPRAEPVPIMITRRDALKATGLAVGAAILLPRFTLPAAAEDANLSTLMEPGPLGDVWLGPKDAKVTIIEYASMTCSHCAAFHKFTWPALKERYIDTNKVRFTLREFPLDPLATAAFMLARCDGDAKYYPITDLLFDQQAAWAYVQKPQSPVDAMEQMLRQAGFSKEKFEACLKDQKLYNAVNTVKQKGMDTFKVDSTPTFFINGERFKGEMTIEGMEKVIKPILGA